MSNAALRAAFVAGVRASLPTVPGTATFGMICGATMVGAGMPPLVAVAAGTLVFAGTLQLAAVQLLATGTPMLLILAACLVMNLRFVMFSASIAPYVRRSTLFRRVLMAYTLSDNSYAAVITRFTEAGQEHAAQSERETFFFGTAVSIWLVWQIATVAGVLVGSTIPADWRLEFTVSLTFIAFGLLNIHDRPTLAAAIAAGATAIAAAGLPFRLGLILGVAAGISAGMAAERLKSR